MTRIESLYMTATPLRTDKVALRNVPRKPTANGGFEYHAEVERSWKEAMDEQAIRRPRAHAQEWELEFKNRNNEPVKITTSELRDLNKKGEFKTTAEFDDWVIKHDLRYTVTYLQKIIMDAVNRLNEKRTQWPGQHQMLVFAMSCSHAKFLANEVFKRLGLEADWMGMWRSESENQAVLKRYKEGELLILVQVDKVSEGFDHPPSSVLLFLNLIVSKVKLMQMLGRGMRRNYAVPFDEDEVDVFADHAHTVVEVVREMQPEEDKGYKKPGEGNGGGGGGAWPQAPEWTEISPNWVRTDEVVPAGSPPYPPGVIKAAERYGKTPQEVQEIVRVAQGQPAESPQESPALGEVARQAVEKDRVDRMMKAVTSHAIRLRAAEGPVDGKRLAGLIKTNLHYEWKRQENPGHDGMLSEDFGRKYTWLRRIDERMRLSGEVESWLTRPRGR